MSDDTRSDDKVTQQVRNSSIAGDSDVSNSDLKQFMLDMRKEMREEMLDMKNDILSKLTENQQDIKQIKDDLTTVRSTLNDVEQATSSHAQRLDDIEQKKVPELKAEMDKKVQLLEEKLLLLEIHDRKRNLLVYGVEEEKNEDTKMVMLDVWHHNYSCSEEQLERGVVMTSCHRLPQSRHARCDSDGKLPPRPVIVRFGFDSDRAFFGNLNNMKRGCKLRVLDDLPPEMKRERGRLASIAYNIRKEQHQSTKIVVAGTKVSLQYKPRNRPDLDWKTYKDSN